jgi:D-3-phosphoglycerate dehydrogenase
VKKVVILLTGMMEEEEQRRFDFLSNHGIEVEYVREYVDDDRPLIERHLQMESKGPDSFTYSPAYISLLQSAYIIVSFYSPVPSCAYDGGNTEAVIVLRSGVENVDVSRATAAGVKVINAPGRLAAPVAEFTIGLMISEMKNIARGHAKLMKGEWSREYANSDTIFNLKGKNVGLVGYGAVGKRVARVITAMDAKVLVFDPYSMPEVLMDAGYRPASLEDLCRESDVILVLYRLTEETVDLINEKHFALMKPTAVLINTARAGLVNEKAMMDALQNHRIAGAGLDVFHEEPLSADSPLLKMENVTITPHLAGTSNDLMDLTFEVVLKCLDHYFLTGEWTNTVN